MLCISMLIQLKQNQKSLQNATSFQIQKSKFLRVFFVNRVLNVMFFFVMQLSRRSKRFKKKRIAKVKIFFQFRAQTLLKNGKKIF